jgi:Phage integrase protein
MYALHVFNRESKSVVTRGEIGRSIGRPVGSLTGVLRGQRWGLHHFAYLRTVEEAVDARSAWDRYLSFQGHPAPGPGHAAGMLLQLCADALAMVDRWPDRRQEVLAAVDTLHEAPPAARPPPLTLDEFVVERGIEVDFYTEAELLEFFHQETAPHPGMKVTATLVESSAASRRLAALRTLESLIAKAPSPRDHVKAWLAPRMARLVGGVTVEELSRTILTLGSAWHRPVRGLGTVQARKMAAWLDSAFGSGHEMALSTKRRAGRPRSGRTPLSLADLAQRAGARSDSLEDDAAWVERWLTGRGQETKREVERFFLWVHCVRRSCCFELRPEAVHPYLSWATGLSHSDNRWLCPTRFERADERWRPFHKALGQRAAHGAARVLLAFISAVQCCPDGPSRPRITNDKDA